MHAEEPREAARHRPAARFRAARSPSSSPTSRARRDCSHACGDAVRRRAGGAPPHVLRAAFAEHGGREVHTEGDAFFVAFARATDAIAAAVAAQRALAAHPWPEGVDLRVRMGLHTGEADGPRRRLRRHGRPPRRAHLLRPPTAARCCCLQRHARARRGRAARRRRARRPRRAPAQGPGPAPSGSTRSSRTSSQRGFPPPRSEARANGASALPPAPNRMIGRDDDVRAIVDAGSAAAGAAADPDRPGRRGQDAARRRGGAREGGAGLRGRRALRLARAAQPPRGRRAGDRDALGIVALCG